MKIRLGVVDDRGGGTKRDEERRGSQWVKMAMSTMNGMYVSRETPAMIRQRNRHVRASVGDGKRRLVLAE